MFYNNLKLYSPVLAGGIGDWKNHFTIGWQWIVWSFPGQMDCSQGDTIQILDIHGADSNTSSEKTIDLLIIIISKSMEKTKDCDECLQFLQYCHFYNKYNRTALNWHKHYNINYVPFTLCTYTLVLQNGHVPLPQFLTPNFLSCYLTTQNYAIKQKEYLLYSDILVLRS